VTYVSAGNDPYNFSEDTLELSRQIYRLLIEVGPDTDEDVTYKYVAGRLGRHHRGLKMALAKIQHECNGQGLPTITTLVVRADTKRPGDGCDATSPNSFRKFRNAVKEIDWPQDPWW